MDVFGSFADRSVREPMDTRIRFASLTVLEFSWFKLARCLVFCGFEMLLGGHCNRKAWYPLVCVLRLPLSVLRLCLSY